MFARGASQASRMNTNKKPRTGGTGAKEALWGVKDARALVFCQLIGGGRTAEKACLPHAKSDTEQVQRALARDAGTFRAIMI